MNDENLITELQREINRNHEILKFYEEIPEGIFAIIMIRQGIKSAEEAISNIDTTAMIRSLAELRKTE